jgi:hypothetical protein
LDAQEQHGAGDIVNHFPHSRLNYEKNRKEEAQQTSDTSQLNMEEKRQAHVFSWHHHELCTSEQVFSIVSSLGGLVKNRYN